MQKRDGVAAAAGIDAKMLHVGSDYGMARMAFAQPHEAEIGEIRLPSGVPLGAVGETGEVVGHNEGRAHPRPASKATYSMVPTRAKWHFGIAGNCGIIGPVQEFDRACRPLRTAAPSADGLQPLGY
jgi:hypothetical protein